MIVATTRIYALSVFDVPGPVSLSVLISRATPVSRTGGKLGLEATASSVLSQGIQSRRQGVVAMLADDRHSGAVCFPGVGVQHYQLYGL